MALTTLHAEFASVPKNWVQVVLGIQEVLASQAMETGIIMPDVPDR